MDLAPPAPPDNSGRQPTARAAQALALVGGSVVVALAALVTASVVMRWLGGQGINGDFELVQMGLALSVFAFLPLCQAHRGNVKVDTFTNRLPLIVQRALDALWDLVYAAFAGFIAWRLWLGAQDAATSYTTSMVLALPIHYAIASCALLAGFLAVVCLFTAAQRLRASS